MDQGNTQSDLINVVKWRLLTPVGEQFAHIIFTIDSFKKQRLCYGFRAKKWSPLAYDNVLYVSALVSVKLACDSGGCSE